MSEGANNELPLDERRLAQERELKNKELALTEREIIVKETKLSRSRWFNPTVLGLFAAAFALSGNVVVAIISSVRVEHDREQSNLVLQAIRTTDHEKSCKNLRAFIRFGLLDDPAKAIDQCMDNLEDTPVLAPEARTAFAAPLRFRGGTLTKRVGNEPLTTENNSSLFITLYLETHVMQFYVGNNQPIEAMITETEDNVHFDTPTLRCDINRLTGRGNLEIKDNNGQFDWKDFKCARRTL